MHKMNASTPKNVTCVSYAFGWKIVKTDALNALLDCLNYQHYNVKWMTFNISLQPTTSNMSINLPLFEG